MFKKMIEFKFNLFKNQYCMYSLKFYFLKKQVLILIYFYFFYLILKVFLK